MNNTVYIILTVKNKEETKLLLMIACDLQSF